MNTQTVELLDEASLWFTVAVTQDDIEHERAQLEAKHDKRLMVFEIERPTHSGVKCTRVTWRCL